jgi:hypothetical protein
MVTNDDSRDLKRLGRIGADPSAIAQRAKAEGVTRRSSDNPTSPCDPCAQLAAFSFHPDVRADDIEKLERRIANQARRN